MYLIEVITEKLFHALLFTIVDCKNITIILKFMITIINDAYNISRYFNEIILRFIIPNDVQPNQPYIVIQNGRA